MVLVADIESPDCPVADTLAAHAAMVRRYVGALSRNPAAVDDLAQEVFVRAIERIDRLHGPDRAAAFLRGIARHVVREHFRACRRSMRDVALTAAALVRDDADIEQTIESRAMLRRLAAEMDRLPVVSRRMLELRYHDGRTADEIGRLLGIGAGAVRVTLLRVRRRLRHRLERAAASPWRR